MSQTADPSMGQFMLECQQRRGILRPEPKPESAASSQGRADHDHRAAPAVALAAEGLIVVVWSSVQPESGRTLARIFNRTPLA
jgi:hypothetical protein